MKHILYLVICIFSVIQSIAQSSYTATWKLEHSLPFSPQQYTDVIFQLNEKQYPIGRLQGKYMPIDNRHPYFQNLPKNAFLGLKHPTNDTMKVIYACKEEQKIVIYEHNPKKELKEAIILKTIALQDNSSAQTTENTEITWQFEEFTQDNILNTQLFLIIKGKQYKIGVYEGKAALLNAQEHNQYALPDTIHSAIQIKGIVVAIKLSEKECVIFEKKPNQELKTIKTLTL